MQTRLILSKLMICANITRLILLYKCSLNMISSFLQPVILNHFT